MNTIVKTYSKNKTSHGEEEGSGTIFQQASIGQEQGTGCTTKIMTSGEEDGTG